MKSAFQLCPFSADALSSASRFRWNAVPPAAAFFGSAFASGSGVASITWRIRPWKYWPSAAAHARTACSPSEKPT